MTDALAVFIAARLAGEVPEVSAKACGCLDVNHWPPCTPQPWKDRKRREIAVWRAILDPYEEALADLERAKAAAPHRPIGDTSLLDAEQELAILRPLAEAVAAVWSDHPDYPRRAESLKLTAAAPACPGGKRGPLDVIGNPDCTLLPAG